MDEKELNRGDLVRIKTKEGIWIGTVLESYDSEIMLLKLESGYNIGIRISDILEVKVEEKKVRGKEVNLKKREKRDGLKNIAMIITGGTISSKLDSKTGGVLWTSVDDIFKIAPELYEICNIVKIEKPFMKGSEDMSFKDWKKIAICAHNLLLDKTIDGIIITHGTDTLHYGAAILSFFIQKLNKPIAFTYSQRSIDRASTDAHLNLLCSAKYACSDIAQIAVVGHEDLNDLSCNALLATKCRKMHSSRRDAFKPINCEPLAKITKEHVEILGEFNPRSDNLPKLDTKYNEKVALVKFTPGSSPEILDYYAKNNYKGVIIEATGLGHLAGKGSDNNWLVTVKRLIKKGMIICIALQTIYGRLNTKVYSNGRELEKTGIIILDDMLPETAFVKLAWILGHKSWVYNQKIVEEKMKKNIAGEFNSKIFFNDF
jgi:glutamyl-tRNA(Gln) amidotransferase subunit D